MRWFERHLAVGDLSDVLDGHGTAAAEVHLAACVRCQAARDRLATMLAAVREGAQADADRALDPGRLERQRHAIRQRIARLGGGRLLAFPAATTAVLPHATRADRRWVTAAAVAGLVVGVAVGRWPSRLISPADLGTTLVSAPMASVAQTPLDPFRDDTLLSDVEEVLTREIRPEFEALDGLTPITDEAR
jgi:hypothetical protein